MRAYQKVLWVVGLVALGAFSLAGFLADAGFIPRTTVYFALTKMWLELTIRLTAGAVFLFLLVLSIYLPISTWLKGAGGWITLSNPLGPLSISTEAISKFIQRTGEKIGGGDRCKDKNQACKRGSRILCNLVSSW